ncbi:MAG TPA: hypothetical protein VGI75_06735 [Pirellulales bacterium]|jgi:hypothetical protein
MSLLRWIVAQASLQQVTAWAAELARDCHEAVAARLGPAVGRMSLSAARGYIQSRASLVLDEQIELLKDRAKTQPVVVTAIRQAAMDEIVRLAIGDLIKSTHSIERRQAA